MKTFKDKANLPPVDKIRKDLGRFHEKADRKVQVAIPKLHTGSKPMHSNPTHSKKNLGFGAYFVLFLLICITSLFLFMLFTLIFVNPSKKTEI